MVAASLSADGAEAVYAKPRALHVMAAPDPAAKTDHGPQHDDDNDDNLMEVDDVPRVEPEGEPDRGAAAQQLHRHHTTPTN